MRRKPTATSSVTTGRGRHLNVKSCGAAHSSCVGCRTLQNNVHSINFRKQKSRHRPNRPKSYQQAVVPAAIASFGQSGSLCRLCGKNLWTHKSASIRVFLQLVSRTRTDSTSTTVRLKRPCEKELSSNVHWYINMILLTS